MLEKIKILILPGEIAIWIMIVMYHWQELPQVPVLSWQIHVCRNKHVTCVFCDKTCLLSQRKYAWRDKTMIVTTKYFCHICRILIIFVTTKHVFCRDKIMQVSFLLRQNVCHDKTVSHDERFLMTSIFLSQQEMFCCDKHMFVMTKIILVAAPTNDSNGF